MSKKNTSVNVLLVDYPGAQLATVMGLQDLFMVASTYSERLDGCAISTHLFSRTKTEEIHNLPFDALILPPNLCGARGQEDHELHFLLKQQHQRGATICSVCAGAFWLGHSQLLNGRVATTHWALAEDLQRDFPKVDVNAEHILIDDNDIVTAGGVMAWVDMGLFLIQKWLGGEVASQTSRHMLIDPGHREQKNYRSFTPPLNHGDQAILSIQHWLESQIEQDISVMELAGQIHLSPRTFLRRFKKATGLPPQAYLQNLRMEKARGYLERTRLPINEIAWRCGYHDPSAFSRLFKSRVGLNAGEYRKRFSLPSYRNNKITNSNTLA